MSSCQIFPLTWQDRYYNIIIIISILWEMCGFYPSPNSNPAVETELELGPLWPYAPSVHSAFLSLGGYIYLCSWCVLP